MTKTDMSLGDSYEIERMQETSKVSIYRFDEEETEHHVVVEKQAA